jgi:hypothetical protein
VGIDTAGKGLSGEFSEVPEDGPSEGSPVVLAWLLSSDPSGLDGPVASKDDISPSIFADVDGAQEIREGVKIPLVAPVEKSIADVKAACTE